MRLTQRVSQNGEAFDFQNENLLIDAYNKSHPSDDRLATTTWQMDVEQDNVRPARSDERDSGRDVLGLAFSATLNAPIPERATFGLFRM